MSSLAHGLVGNGQVLALVAPDSAIEWLCMPAFDSPSVFAALLDRDRGGRFAIAPSGGGGEWSQRYLDDSNVLVTECSAGSGDFEVVDFCPGGDDAPAPAEIVRIVRPLGEAARVAVAFEPRIDYGRGRAAPVRVGDALAVDDLILHASVDVDRVGAGDPIELSGGDALVLVLSWGRPTVVASASAAAAALDRATATDRSYIGDLDPTLARSPEIRRSALAVRAHTAASSGAIIAAATTSIPEAIGTPRTWDYRYCWIRDASFAAHALLSLGDHRTAARLLDFFERTVDPSAPQPLYGIDGRAELPESTLPHLRGYADTGPVRIGNAAALQTQHDVGGQIVWLADELARATGTEPSAERLRWLDRLVEGAAAAAAEPDAGIWEFRDRPRHYTFSQLWCWVALDRGAAIANRAGDSARADDLRTRADQQRDRILTAANDTGFFGQTLTGRDADASSLQVAMLGLVPPADPLYRRTVEVVERELSHRGLLRRYQIEDDFGDTTSAFLLCSLWWVAALAATDRRDRAASLYDHILSHASPVGLLSEDVDPDTATRLGNYPQVYSHVGIIQASLALSR